MILCDGCNVSEGWEHRCHSASGQPDISVRGEMLFGTKCDCAPCRELESLSSEEIRRRLLGGDYDG